MVTSKRFINEQELQEIRELFRNELLKNEKKSDFKFKKTDFYKKMGEQLNVHWTTILRIVEYHGAYSPYTQQSKELTWMKPYLGIMGRILCMSECYGEENIYLEGIVDGGEKFVQPIKYFNGDNLVEKVFDLYSTMELNPPEVMNIKFPNSSIKIV